MPWSCAGAAKESANANKELWMMLRQCTYVLAAGASFHAISRCELKTLLWPNA